MYSILKIFPGIKLTFMLIIFGIGGIYLLEHKHISRQKPFPEPPAIYHAGINHGSVQPDRRELENSSKGTRTQGKSLSGDESVKSPSRVHNLGELGLHIEL